jgi:hypothetical protein
VSRLSTGYCDYRSIGVKIEGDYKYAKYKIGLYNSSGQNAKDLNNSGLIYVGSAPVNSLNYFNSKKYSYLELGE